MNWKQFNRANNLLGWAIFAVATLTYLLTIGPSASLWDCAEFIACDYKLEIGHPPGAPFYMLVYNVMSHLGGSPERAALMTNATSAVLSGLTILFLFWTITHMVRRVLTLARILGKQGFEPTGEVMTMGRLSLSSALVWWVAWCTRSPTPSGSAPSRRRCMPSARSSQRWSSG